MKLTLNDTTSRHFIHSYGTDYVLINHQRYTRSLIVLPDTIIPDWPPQRIEDLTLDHFQPVIQPPVDVVLLGTGEQTRFPARSLLAALEAQGIGLEVMNTGAACRTFTLLVSERRTVAVCFLLG